MRGRGSHPAACQAARTRPATRCAAASICSSVVICLLMAWHLPSALAQSNESSNAQDHVAASGVTPASHGRRLEGEHRPPGAASNAPPIPLPALPPIDDTLPIVAQPNWLYRLYDEIALGTQREQALRQQVQSLRAQLADANLANAALTGALEAEREASAAIQSMQAVLDSRMAVAESAQEALGAELAAARAEIAHLQRRVAFFERLVPDGNAGRGISIRSAEVNALGDNLVQYRVLVMRHGPAHEAFQGTLEFVATGTQDGSSATIALERLATAPISESGAPSANTVASLDFQQYQRASGLLAIPPGFEPATITVRVMQGEAVRAEQTMTLAKESPK